MADGFHIDGDGNLWIGSTSTNFDNNAAFYVKTDGEMKATSGEIGGLDIESVRIKSTNYSTANSEGFQIHSDGTAKFYGSLTANSLSAAGANISGNITATDGTIGGTQINSSNIESTTFDSNTGYQIGANSATFHDVTVTGTISGANIDGTVSGTLATANSGTRVELSSGNDAGFIRYFSGSQQTGTISSSSGGLEVSADTGDFLTLAGATGIKWFGPAYFFDGSSYSNTTNTNFVVRADSNGKPYWGSVPASAGVTAIQESSNVLSLSGNTGSIVIGDNHTSNHHASSDHTGNSNTNLATLGYVNSRGFGFGNGNSNLGAHDNGSHNVDYGTGNGNGNSNINASSVNSLISGHIKVNTGYNHASSVHNNGNGNGNMNSTNHYNSNIAFNTHMHPNAIIHDSRLLNINANNVPGVNFVNRLNPVQTNYVSNVETRLSSKEQLSGFISDHIEATAFTLTAQDVKQALTDDGYTGDYALYLPNVDYLTEEHGSDIGEGEEVQGFSDEHLVPVLVQAIKDLSATIQTLEDRITTLEG